MQLLFNRLVIMVLLVALNLAQTGCVTSKKYKMAKDDALPAKPLGWTVSTPPAEVTLETVIVIKGPGSWKREAKWDEYVVRVTNHGDQPLRIDSATLIDVLGYPQVPGVEPWKLEALSSSNWDKYGGVGLSLLAGTGAVTAIGVAAFAAGGPIISMGAPAVVGGSALAAAAVVIMPIAAVVDITAVAVINHKNKKKVVAEFSRRRLVLPQTIAPGATAEGSYFFPMTPGPQRLVLQGHAGETPLELELDLKQLATLHLKPKGKPAM